MRQSARKYKVIAAAGDLRHVPVDSGMKFRTYSGMVSSTKITKRADLYISSAAARYYLEAYA
jgi:hypothetical protein